MFVKKEDRIKLSKVFDKEVNEEFQEARKLDPSILIEESYKVRKNNFLAKKQTVTYYQIYHETHPHDEVPYQARYQISGSGNKQIVIAYLHGIINGINHQKYKTEIGK